MDILVNNEIKTLSITDKNGIDWISDLLGNADAFDGYDDDRELHVMEAENFGWWELYVEFEQCLSDTIIEIRGNMDYGTLELFDAGLIESTNGENDLDMMQLSQFKYVSFYVGKFTG